MVRVKICGLVRADDVVYALEQGADAVGFVFEPTSPRYVGDHHYDILMGLCGPYATTVAVFGEQNRPVPEAGAVQAIRFAGEPVPGQIRIQTLRLQPDAEIEEEVLGTEPGLPVVLDAYSGTEFGGTGRQVDWNLAARLVTRFAERGSPVILAGGLTPENVGEAVRQVQPYAVDVSSGVESSPGVKDPAKVRDFILAAKALV